MRKILLVIEEYRELVALENLLRRIGFDVLSISKDVLVNDALLRFTPDIVIANLKTRAVDGHKLSARFRKSLPTTRLALTYQSTGAIDLTEEVKELVDAVIMIPAKPNNVIRVIASLGQLDPAPLLAKYEKLMAQKAIEPSTIFVTGDPTARTDDSMFVDGGAGEKPHVPIEQVRTARSDRYDKFLADTNDDVSQVLSREKAQAAMRKLKKSAASEQDELDRIDYEKRVFVKTLFESKAPPSRKK